MERPRLSRKSYIRRPSFFLAVIFGLFALGIGAYSAYISRSATLLATEGVEAQALIVDKVHTTSRRRGGGTNDHYDVTVEFPGPTGETVRAEHGVSSAFYSRYGIGDTITLTYARSNPQLIEVEAGTTGEKAGVLKWIAITMAVLALISALILWRGLAVLRSVAREGERRMALVFDHRPSGKQSLQISTFGWDINGEVGRSSPIPNKKLPPIGSEVAMYVHPRSGRTIWEGEF